MVQAESGVDVNDPATWPTFGIPSLIQEVEAAHNEQKYLFIWDKSDQTDTFFKYKGFLCDLFF